MKSNNVFNHDATIFKWVHLLVIVNVLFAGFIYGGSITKDFEFPVYSLRFDYRDGYTIATLKGCDLTLWEPGKPVIPYVNLNVLIPPSAEITSIEISDVQRTEIPGEFLLYPAQEPRIISDNTNKSFIHPDRTTYQLTSEYPTKMSEIIPSGNKSEFRIGGVFLYPLKYIPAERRLVLYERIRVKINYEEGKYQVGSLTESQKRLFSRSVKDLVINPEDVNKFSPRTRITDNPDIDYIILTNTTLEPRFGTIIRWLRKTGIWADTFNTSWVYANYTGRDNQEKIRKFIIDYYTNHGLKYVLLAGDVSVVPVRGVYAEVNTSPATIDSFIPSDLYYADLQYSWDGNQNNIFGDNFLISGKRDTVDLYYDVYVGRWPVENAAETDTMIRKFFTYTRNPDTLYQKRMLLPAAYLWSGYDHTQSQDTIANLSPSGWTDRVINMGTNDGWRWAVRDSLNTGFGFTHMVGHGNSYGVYINNSAMYYYTDPATQNNYNKLTIANANSCISGNMETNDCLAEEMVLARGSAIAVMMNSRYGWGYDNQIGPSEQLDVRFYHFLFSRDSLRIANCHQSSKEIYRNSAMTIGEWRWCYCELNLFGEPQMMMWKDNPKKMVARYSNPIGTGSQTFAVVCSSQGSPLAGAIVTVWKGSEVYAKSLTNANGQVSLSINPSTNGYMYVTVTAKNKIPLEDSTQVVYLKDIQVVSIDNPAGTIDSSGSAVVPRAQVKNNGSNSETFNVTFKIGSSYTYTRSKTLGAGVLDTVNFISWVPMRGTYPTRCSVYLSSDAVRSNDTLNGSVIVQVKDVGVTAIENPVSVIDSTSALVYPRARVKNYGTNPATFNIVFKIGSIYTGNRSKTVNAGVEDTVNFTGWIPVRGTYLTRCSVALVNDVVKSNDTLAGSAIIQVKDVGVTAIENPVGATDSSSALVYPRARVKNYGTNPATFDVTFKIGDIYINTRPKTLNAGIEDTVNFTGWIPVRGIYPTRCSVALAGDAAKSNDTFANSITVQVKDVGVTEIVAPIGTFDSLTLVTPACSVYNYGTTTQTYLVRMKVGSFYNDTFRVVSQAGSGKNYVSFTTLANWPRGTHTVSCSTELAIDENPSNNKKTGSIIVTVVIPAPWTLMRSVPISSKKVKGGGSLINGTAGLMYGLKGNNTREFFAYDIGDDTWIIKESIPEDPFNRKRTNKGARLVYNKHSNPDMIYATKGNNTLEFWAYDVDSNAWSAKPSVPYNPAKVKKVKGGAALVFIKRGSQHYLYLLKGNNTREFYGYHCQEDTWIKSLDSAPIGPDNKRYKDGSCMTVVDDDIYLLKGGAKFNEFYRYNTAEDSWYTMESIPKYNTITRKKTKVKDGGALTYDGDSLIYAFKGGSQEFWVYNTLRNTWDEADTIPKGALKKKVGSGGSLAYADYKVYALKGNNCFEYWCYNPAVGMSNVKYQMPNLAEQTANLQLTTHQLKNSSLTINPNPFSNQTTILYNVPVAGKVSIKLYNTTGKLVSILLNESKPAGSYLLKLNQNLPQGVYFIKYDNGTNTSETKVIVE